ncbi:hypothetical protein ACFO3O_09260 [Dokdonia ponticola]|uniref:Uncharacterized protein n=1 Tax=Dokdonia ponticola TaxID=2041041 RepID=A0ABV9HVB0_9FLAO
MKKKRKKKQILYIFDRQKLKQAIKRKNKNRPDFNNRIKKGNLLTLCTLFENYQNLLNEKTTGHTYEYPYFCNDISKIDIGSDTMPMLYVHARKIAQETGQDVKTIKNHIRQLRHKSNNLITIVDYRTGSSFGVKIPYHYFMKVLVLKRDRSFPRDHL